MKDFVTFEIAKKLEEKWFKQDYNIFGYKLIFSDENTIKYISDIGAYEKEYFGINIPCPSISEVLKWLREEKELHIEIYMYHNCYLWEIYNTQIYDADLTQKSEKYSEIEYETYEQAALAGIEYALDNLIS
jgi:hypothetical protein